MYGLTQKRSRGEEPGQTSAFGKIRILIKPFNGSSTLRSLFYLRYLKTMIVYLSILFCCVVNFSTVKSRSFFASSLTLSCVSRPPTTPPRFRGDSMGHSEAGRY